MFTTRFYRPDHQDSARVLDFIRSLSADPTEIPGFGIGEFCYTAYRDLNPPMSETLGICTDDSAEIVALCWLEPECEVGLSIAPNLKHGPHLATLYRHLFDVAQTGLRALTPGLTQSIGTTIATDDNVDITVLTAIGLQTAGDIRHHTFRALPGAPIAEPALPDGYRFVAIEDASRYEQRIALVKSVWPEHTLDQRRYHQLREAPFYRPDLDLCVQTDAGQLVAFALGWLDPENRTCQFEPIGTHPDHRGKGIGKALVQHASLLARSMGADRLYINCYAKNDAGNALYTAAGYDLVRRWQWWEFPAAEVSK